MSDEVLGDRRRALEDEFFRKQDAKILEKLRLARERQATRDSLADASGIHDDVILNLLVEHKIDATTLAAFALVPLVEVAWADGKLDTRERDAVLNGATDQGIKAGSMAYHLLLNWLDSPSAPSLLRGWVDYTRTLCSKMDAKQRSRLRKEVLGRAEQVAEAAGGFLGLGSTSAEEKEVLRLLEGAFED